MVCFTLQKLTMKHRLVLPLLGPWGLILVTATKTKAAVEVHANKLRVDYCDVCINGNE